MTTPNARGWAVHWYDRERVFRDAAAVLGCEDVNAVLSAMGRSIGPPWQARHKLAAAAALSVTGRICSGGILVRGQDILLGKRSADRSFCPGVWDVIGGHCETGEAPADALVRELREEIGVEAVIVEQIAILGEPQSEANDEIRCHVFVVARWDGEPELRNSEHSELRWVRASEAEDLPLAHPDYPVLFREAIRRARAAGVTREDPRS